MTNYFLSLLYYFCFCFTCKVNLLALVFSLLPTHTHTCPPTHTHRSFISGTTSFNTTLLTNPRVLAYDIMIQMITCRIKSMTNGCNILCRLYFFSHVSGDLCCSVHQLVSPPLILHLNNYGMDYPGYRHSWIPEDES